MKTDQDITAYRQRIAKCEILSSKEEKELATLLRNSKYNDSSGNLSQAQNDARNRLIHSQLRQAFQLANDYRFNGNFGDLLSVANEMVVIAVDELDSQRGNLYSLVRRVIPNAILSYFRHQRTRKVSTPMPSIDDGYHEKGDNEQKSPPMRVTRDDDLKTLEFILGALDPRERYVINLKFPLDGSKPLTSTEVSQRLGVTRQSVDRTQIMALKKLRYPAILHQLG